MVRLVKPEEIISPPKKGLRICEENGEFTTGEFKCLCNISERQAFNDLKSLLKMGFLIRTGSGRATGHVPTSNHELRD